MGASDHRDIAVLCTLGLRSVVMDIADAFARTSGYALAAEYQSSKALVQRIADGLSADVAIVTDMAIAALINEGKILADSRRNLASSGVGLAVRQGARKPDISSAATLKQTLLAARGIAFSHTGASGIHFADVIDRLGIAENVRAKARIQDGLVGELAARGEVEIAVQQISELRQVAGLDVIGPLPPELQQETIFCAGIFAASKNKAAATALITRLASAETAAIIDSKGMQALR